VLKCPHYLPLERRPSTVCLCAIKQPFLIFIASDSGLHRHEQPKRRKSLILYSVPRTLTTSSTFAAPEHMYSMTQQAENSHQIASFGSVARPNSFLLFVLILLLSYLLVPFIELSDRCAATCGTGQGFSGNASIDYLPHFKNVGVVTGAQKPDLKATETVVTLMHVLNHSSGLFYRLEMPNPIYLISKPYSSAQDGEDATGHFLDKIKVNVLA